MSIFGKLFGKKPSDPPGTYYLDGGALVGDPFVIRRKSDDRRVGPSFTSIAEAGLYRDSLEGGAPYRYPSGAV